METKSNRLTRVVNLTLVIEGARTRFVVEPVSKAKVRPVGLPIVGRSNFVTFDLEIDPSGATRFKRVRR